MALPDYFQRGAVAISQVIAGFDEAAIRGRLDGMVLGISIAKSAAGTSEGAAIADLVVRLAARLYPAMQLDGPSESVAKLSDLARSINPEVELRAYGIPTVEIAIGGRRRLRSTPTVYAGSSGWSAYVSAKGPVPVGRSRLPFGAGASACLAMAAVFRHVFIGTPLMDGDTQFKVVPVEPPARHAHLRVHSNLALVGVGAVGNGAVWTMSNLPVRAPVDVVDPELVELSNLQRYVMAGRDDVGVRKVDLARAYLPDAHTYHMDLAEYLNVTGFSHDAIAVSVDSVRGRVAAQASLPRVVVNAWTQPGDLGVSEHTFVGDGACLACLYLPKSVSPSEDAVYALALGIPEQQMQVRNLLYNGEPVPPPLLSLIAERLAIDADLASAFVGADVRRLYREGICGGALLPIESAGVPRREVHVPLAHQSALAGIMLAARCFSAPDAAGKGRTIVSRLDVLRPLQGGFIDQFALKDAGGLCICQDSDYIAAYEAKYGQ